MSDPQVMIDLLEKNALNANLLRDPIWANLKRFIAEHYTPMTSMRVGTVYIFKGKGPIMLTGVCTKENGKSYIVYETNQSGDPGARWTLGKTWCTQENIQRSVAQSYALPSHVVLK
jgi:hypothetical protein